MKGTVKFFNARRGFGYITAEDGTDYFCHQSDIQKEGFRKLKPDQSVTFELGEYEGKTKAVNIVPA